MNETGTLEELNVKPGDVVENQKSNYQYTITEDMYVGCVKVMYSVDPYRIISRAPDTPKLWLDMTAEEKGALLLAHQEGKVIEWYCFDMWLTDGSIEWKDCIAYRVKPKPKVEVVALGGGYTKGMGWVFWDHIHVFLCNIEN